MPSRKYKIYNDVMVCDTKWINLSSNHMTMCECLSCRLKLYISFTKNPLTNLLFFILLEIDSYTSLHLFLLD